MECAPKEILKAQIYGKRKRGCPRSSWINKIEKDKKIVEKRNWIAKASDQGK